MKGIGAASWIIGLSVALQTGVEIRLSANTKAITDRFSLRATYLLSFVALPIRCLLYFINKSPVLGLAIQNLHGFYIFSTFIVGMIVLDMNLKPEWRSTGQAYYYSAFSGIGAMPGSFIGPLIFDNQGISALWAIAAVIAFIGYLLVNHATRKLIPIREKNLLYKPSHTCLLPKGERAGGTFLRPGFTRGGETPEDKAKANCAADAAHHYK